MMGVGRQCKPAVTWSGGGGFPFLADLRWVGLCLTKGRRTTQRFGVSVESGDGQSPPICDSRCIGTTHVSGAREAEGEGGQAPGRAGLLGGVWSVGRGWGRERPRRVT